MLYATWIHGSEDIAPAKTVREDVFVKEQGYAPEVEFDAFDAMAWHAVAMDDEKPIATGRIYLDQSKFNLGRVCVLPEYRGFGVGDAVVRLLIDRALTAGAEGIHICAQTYCKDLYKKFGFEEVGEPYFPEGDKIEHVDLYADSQNIVLPTACGGGCGGGCDSCAGCGGDESEEEEAGE